MHAPHALQPLKPRRGSAHARGVLDNCCAIGGGGVRPRRALLPCVPRPLSPRRARVALRPVAAASGRGPPHGGSADEQGPWSPDEAAPAGGAARRIASALVSAAVSGTLLLESAHGAALDGAVRARAHASGGGLRRRCCAAFGVRPAGGWAFQRPLGGN
jgi:hypothetical protein